MESLVLPAYSLEAIEFDELPKSVQVDLYYNLNVNLVPHWTPARPISDVEVGKLLDCEGNYHWVFAFETTYFPSGATEDRHFVRSTNALGEVTGKAEMRYMLDELPVSDRYRGRPFVGMTRTEERIQRQGLGINRLCAMNYLALRKYDAPLRSSGLISPDAEAVWQKLVKQGEAEVLAEIDTKTEGKVYYQFAT